MSILVGSETSLVAQGSAGGTAESKIGAFRACGVAVAESPDEIGSAMKRLMK